MLKKFAFALVLVAAVVAGLSVSMWRQGPSNTAGYPGFGGDFTLDSVNGSTSLSDFRGDVVVLYFGFASCPDVCPATLGKVRAALAELSRGERDRVNVVLVSLDPERDTPERVGAYAASFGEKFIGLTGAGAAIDEVARNYGVLHQKVELPDSALGYTIDHNSNTFVIGADGVVRHIVSHGSDVSEYRDRIRDTLDDA